MAYKISKYTVSWTVSLHNNQHHPSIALLTLHTSSSLYKRLHRTNGQWSWHIYRLSWVYFSAVVCLEGFYHNILLAYSDGCRISWVWFLLLLRTLWCVPWAEDIIASRLFLLGMFLPLVIMMIIIIQNSSHAWRTNSERSKRVSE